jgi:hypothetical protein
MKQNYFITLTLIALFGILNGQMDVIATTPNRAWFDGWWIANNWSYDNEVIQWIMRYPLSFAKDGWHLLKSLCMVIGAVALYFAPDKRKWYLIIVYIFVYGAFFNISYHI